MAPPSEKQKGILRITVFAIAVIALSVAAFCLFRSWRIKRETCYEREYIKEQERFEKVEAEMDESERLGTSPVKSLMPNELGLYDMSGNVCEWCSDWYNEAYEHSSSNDSHGPDTGEFRVVRGGSWFDLEFGCCIYARGIHEPAKRSSDTGLRLVLSQE